MALETQIDVLALTAVGGGITTEPLNMEGAKETFIHVSGDVRVYTQNWNGVGAVAATQYFIIPATNTSTPFRTISNSGYWYLVGDAGAVTARILQVRDSEYA